MTATLRAIACRDAQSRTEAIDLLSDLVLLSDRKALKRGPVVRTAMHAWLTSDLAQVSRLAQLVTNEGANEVTRLVDAAERRTCFGPLEQRVGAASL